MRRWTGGVHRISRWLLLGLGIVACAEKQGEPELRFQVQHWDLVLGSTLPHPPEGRRVVASPIPTGIRVTGAVVLPDPCDKVEARLEPGEDTLRLRVRVLSSQSNAERCGGGNREEVNYYEAEIRNLTPGTYRLHVFHDFVGHRGAAPTDEPRHELVLDESVQVPE